MRQLPSSLGPTKELLGREEGRRWRTKPRWYRAARRCAAEIGCNGFGLPPPAYEPEAYSSDRIKAQALPPATLQAVA